MHSGNDWRGFSAIRNCNFQNSYRAAVVRPPNWGCKSNSYTEESEAPSCRCGNSGSFLSQSRSPPSHANAEIVEILNAPRKPHFWTAGRIPPSWVPGALLQLLVGRPSPTGSSSGNSVWSLSSSFSFSAPANWCLERTRQSALAPPRCKLKLKETTLQVNALTMISKRVERDEPVSVQWLLDKTREQLAVSEKKFR